MLAEARTLISAAAGTIRKASSLYETAPWGKSDQGWFLNQALQVETEADPAASQFARHRSDHGVTRETECEQDGKRP